MDYSQRQIRSMKKALFEQKYIDDQFHQLEELQDSSSPNFVEEVVALFFRDSSRLINSIEQALEKSPRDFRRLEAFMHQFKGSCSSIGALRLKNECSFLTEFCNEGNIEGCRKSLQKVKREHGILRQKLESYFQALRQFGPMEKAARPN